jgi:hypothetical protein
MQYVRQIQRNKRELIAHAVGEGGLSQRQVDQERLGVSHQLPCYNVLHYVNEFSVIESCIRVNVIWYRGGIAVKNTDLHTAVLLQATDDVGHIKVKNPDGSSIHYFSVVVQTLDIYVWDK